MEDACIDVSRATDKGGLARAGVLVGAGLAALALGALVYLTDRPAGHASLIPSIAALAGAGLFGAAGQWLPSFAHPLAFGLLTAAALPPGSRWAGRGCVAWCGVDALFEAGQHPAAGRWLAHRLAELPDPTGAAGAFAGYFIHGTWDPGDLTAAALGTVCALWVLRIAAHPRELDHG